MWAATGSDVSNADVSSNKIISQLLPIQCHIFPSATCLRALPPKQTPIWRKTSETKEVMVQYSTGSTCELQNQ